MMDMVEKVAMAIRPEAFEPITEGARTAGMTEFLEKCRERGIEQALKRARAAIEAMREPTDEMRTAGCQADDPLGGLVDWKGENCTTRDAVAHVFTAMIDAALSSTKEGGE